MFGLKQSQLDKPLINASNEANFLIDFQSIYLQYAKMVRCFRIYNYGVCLFALVSLAWQIHYSPEVSLPLATVLYLPQALWCYITIKIPKIFRDFQSTTPCAPWIIFILLVFIFLSVIFRTGMLLQNTGILMGQIIALCLNIVIISLIDIKRRAIQSKVAQRIECLQVPILHVTNTQFPEFISNEVILSMPESPSVARRSIAPITPSFYASPCFSFEPEFATFGSFKNDSLFYRKYDKLFDIDEFKGLNSS